MAANMLDPYIHDYLVKRNLHDTARIFAKEANIDPHNQLAIKDSEGFLYEWWSVFFDAYNATCANKERGTDMRLQTDENQIEMMGFKNQIEMPAVYSSSSSFSPNIDMMMAQAMAKYEDPISYPGFVSANGHGNYGSVSSNSLVGHTQPISLPMNGADSSPFELIDANSMGLLRDIMKEGDAANVSTSSQGHSLLTTDIHGKLYSGSTQKLLPVDPSPRYGQEDANTHSKFQGRSFGEVGCLRLSDKVSSCHFSSDGKFLASGGYDKKVVLWNMDTLKIQSGPEEHQHVITSVCFRPNSTQLATTSLDKSVRLWDAANPSCSLQAYTGHPWEILSLDFHPKKNDLFCFGDGSNVIQYWNINPLSCTRVSKGSGAAVRFQPTTGHLLAAAPTYISDELVSLFDVETAKQIHSFKGNPGRVFSVCWNFSGDCVAAVTPESVQVWSLASGKCIRKHESNMNKSYSCVYHPMDTLMVIGGERSLILWNLAEDKMIPVPAHRGPIGALAMSSVTGMVASGSCDQTIKLWN